MKIIYIIILFCAQCALAQNNDVITPTSNLVVQGIPDIPVSIKNEVLRYTESRSASISDWHPVNRHMIMATRFANVPQLHLLKNPLGARKQITFFEDAVANATYEPVKGEYFLFTRDVGGNEFGQIYRYNVSDGNITLLSDGGRSQNGGIRWSRNGKQITYASTRRNGADRDIYIMDPKDPSTNKMILQVSGGGWAALDWSADDKKLLVGEYISANEGHLWLLDIASGTKSELTDRTRKNVSIGGVVFTTDGRGIYFSTDEGNEFHRLAYMDLATKKTKFITTIPWDIDDFDLSDDGRNLAFTTNEAGESKLYVLNTSSNNYRKIEILPQGLYSSLQFHNNNKDLALNVSGARSAADIYVIDINTNKAERWTESEMGGIVPDQLSIPTLIKWKSFDDKEITGFYYKPHSKFTGKRPVVINIHGGPEGQSRPGYLGSSNYYLNEMGVAIIFPNVRGSSGYGKTFLTLDNGMKREESVKDIGALLDWIAKQPELDAQRVMVTGGSYGGYMTLAVATMYNDRIKASLDVVGVSNFNTFLKNTESYRRDLRRVEYGDERDPAMYAYFEKIAPLNNAGMIKKPMFIVQGGNDPRVPRTEAVQMFDKIKSNGGVVWYLEAKDEGHGFRKKTNVDYQRLATILFMQKYLL